VTTVYDFSETEMGGKTIDLKDYEGKVVLIVNTASKCGFTPQFKGLESLYKKYHDQGLEVLGLPSNQFKQELDSDEAASEFCQMHYGVTFPITTRVAVNGDDEDALFTYLKDASGEGDIEWNFTKFLVGRDGQLVSRFTPDTEPESFEADIVKALAAK